MAHALSDDQVAGELKKMVAFIKQEAIEKAREIEIKADEEFAIEKSKLVRQEVSSIDAQYERKFKQAELSQQVKRSKVTNSTRLKILAARQELLDSIFERAREKLADVSKDTAGYTEILKNLVLEGLYALNEAKVNVRGRKADSEVLKEAIDKAAGEYKEQTGLDANITVDENNALPEGSHGGVWIIGTGGKITINNTLEERLKIIQSESLPAVRYGIFGENKNRKFYD
ncbi:ATPase, V1/A1 complex, subunit E [Ascodesmis nigricans]|uniref:ATPase, V1/A1 complex, subunit E n=1 Tax=Ascodesmis nigricans TaxID=341454 RepID=A0A4S2N8B1_9PEZI|nr:ATPase, V1/A1 complex, subunit E [Ascodesmis nigricans]